MWDTGLFGGSVGLIAGRAAGQIMKGGGYGAIADILLGIVGGIVGGGSLACLGRVVGALSGA